MKNAAIPLILVGCALLPPLVAGHTAGAADSAAAPVILKIPELGKVHAAGPFTHQNLAVFLFYRTERPEAEIDYLTLEEAVKAKLVEVTEADQEQVQQLLITNRGSKPVFLAAGELVKGGKQDRTLQSSLVIPPQTRKMPIPSFCVESGRWSGGKQFGAGANIAANASQQALIVQGQSAVWQSVAKYKQQLRENVAKATGKTVKQSRTSSLNEELNDIEVKDLLHGYEKALANVGQELPYTLGMAYAVDGKVTAFHVFRSGSLFAKMKPKLIRSAAIDAAAGAMDKEPKTVTADDLANFIAAAWDGERKTQDPASGNRVVRLIGSDTFTSELLYEDRLVHTQVGRIDPAALQAGARQQIQQAIQQLAPQQSSNQRLLPQLIQRAINNAPDQNNLQQDNPPSQEDRQQQ
jgi:hypothetical protein